MSIAVEWDVKQQNKDNSFEHPKHMLKIVGTKKFYTEIFCLSKHVYSYQTYVVDTQKEALGR